MNYLAQVGNRIYALHSFDKESAKTGKKDLAVARSGGKRVLARPRQPAHAQKMLPFRNSFSRIRSKLEMAEGSLPNLEFIHPASPPADRRRWILSPIDIYAVRWLIQGTWIFNADLDTRLLKQGLSRLLDLYPILCGRVVRGKEIEYRDGGIPFTITSEESLAVDDFSAECRDVRRFGDRRSLTKIRQGREPLVTVRSQPAGQHDRKRGLGLIP